MTGFALGERLFDSCWEPGKLSDEACPERAGERFNSILNLRAVLIAGFRETKNGPGTAVVGRNPIVNLPHYATEQFGKGMVSLTYACRATTR